MGPAGTFGGFRRLIVGVPRSPLARGLAVEGIRFAERYGAKVDFVHAGEDTQSLRSALEGILHPVVPGTELVSLTIRDGQPDAVLCAAARERQADLIVVGAGEKDNPDPKTGGVARRVARRAHCSVLVFPQTQRQGTRFRIVVAGVEYGPEAPDFVRFALDVARRYFAPILYLVREIDPGDSRALAESPLVSSGIDPESVWHWAEQNELQSLIDEMDPRGVAVEPVCVRGTEWNGAAAFATHHQADLLILPADSTTRISMALNSGSLFALRGRSLTCPILFVRRVAPGSEQVTAAHRLESLPQTEEA